jgi:hypothetical protein
MRVADLIGALFGESAPTGVQQALEAVAMERARLRASWATTLEDMGGSYQTGGRCVRSFYACRDLGDGQTLIDEFEISVTMQDLVEATA